MKKLLIIAMAALLIGYVVPASAQDGDFEISGHINTGLGWQYHSKAAIGAMGGAFYQEGMLPLDANLKADSKLSHTNNILFYVGEVELDVAKTFGENIRLRTDLDFGRLNSYGYDNAFQFDRMVEQAYATVNIPVGYGLEFLVGRFNAPMGFEAVDNNDNDLPFHSLIYNFLRPQNLTGIKFYYPFSDMFDMHIWLANNLRDVMGDAAAGNAIKDSQVPAFGLRLGVTWGEEGQESTVGLSGAGSPEAIGVTATSNPKLGQWSYLGDLDFNIWVNDVFAIGGEGYFRRDGATKLAKTGGFKDNYYYAGLLNLHYVFSDVWDGTLRYVYAMDKNGSAVIGDGKGVSTLLTAIAANQFHRYQQGVGSALVSGSALGAKLQDHSIDLGINYHITDGAKLMAMYRFEYIIPAKRGLARNYANLNKTAMSHSLAANFAYEF